MNLVPKLPAEEVLAAVAGPVAQPACILDLEGCQLLAANEAGHLLWGTDGRQPPITLDTAMPGLAHLRSFVGSAADGEAGPETLAFWTWRGLLAMPCVYRRVSLKHARATVLVTWPPNATSHGQGPIEESTADPAPADVATLRQVAHRVRGRSDAAGKQAADQGGKSAASARLNLHAPGQREHDPDTLARLSHELRTPLGAVIALAETMTEEHFGPLPNERYREYIRDIRDSARHALAVVEGMLARKGDADEHLELAFAEVDLNDTVEACIATIRPLAEKAGLALSVDLSDGMPHVVADRRCLKQILLNLLSNCVKYAGAGAEVRISSGYELAGPVWIAVSDTGPGIPADVVARTMGTANGSLGGDAAAGAGRRTGLGLPLSRQLARANGARLELDGAGGKGTCVRVVFGKDRAVPV